MDCKIKIRYVTTTHSTHADDCTFKPYNEFSTEGPNIWWSSVNGCKILITQNGRNEIDETNIQFEPNSLTGIVTQKWEIAKAFNDFIAEVYR
jgi:hypothetical protein